MKCVSGRKSFWYSPALCRPWLSISSEYFKSILRVQWLVRTFLFLLYLSVLESWSLCTHRVLFLSHQFFPSFPSAVYLNLILLYSMRIHALVQSQLRGKQVPHTPRFSWHYHLSSLMQIHFDCSDFFWVSAAYLLCGVVKDTCSIANVKMKSIYYTLEAALCNIWVYRLLRLPHVT